jgi:hypothetical protein
VNNWINRFKTAISTEDLKQCERLMQRLPESFATKEEVQEAAALTKEAIAIFEKGKAELNEELTKLRRVKKYLKNT